jgi:hypothetical protein
MFPSIDPNRSFADGRFERDFLMPSPCEVEGVAFGIWQAELRID